MTPLTAAQKQAQKQARKQGKEFADEYLNRQIIDNEYMDSQILVSFEDFVEAKEAEFCVKHGVAAVSMAAVFINQFSSLLENYDNEWASQYYDDSEIDEDYFVYHIETLLAAWKEAEKLCN